MLTDLGYEVTTCGSSSEALEYYSRNAETTDLILLDTPAPDATGLEILRAMRRINPQAKVFMTSDAPLDDRMKEILDEGALGVLGRPLRLAELGAKVEQALVSS